jgi:hypothetical protein
MKTYAATRPFNPEDFWDGDILTVSQAKHAAEVANKKFAALGADGHTIKVFVSDCGGAVGDFEVEIQGGEVDVSIGCCSHTVHSDLRAENERLKELLRASRRGEAK